MTSFNWTVDVHTWVSLLLMWVESIICCQLVLGKNSGTIFGYLAFFFKSLCEMVQQGAMRAFSALIITNYTGVISTCGQCSIFFRASALTITNYTRVMSTCSQCSIFSFVVMMLDLNVLRNNSSFPISLAMTKGDESTLNPAIYIR